jgi:peptide/nickel transport system ATP-binding protein/glutathione transport system ATP-binding protein
VLEVEGVSTRFALRRGLLRRASAVINAVDDVSLSVAPGETLGLVGESGCGKTTLARTVLRLGPRHAGRIRIGGQDVSDLKGRALLPMRRMAQMVFQDPFASLNPRLPVWDLVTEPAHIHGLDTARDRRALAERLMEKVGLPADCIGRYPHQFSGGQRQRLCIARALSVEPRLIVADEPVSALDVSIARQVTDLIQDLQRRERLALLFISHDIAVVERVSHRIAVMFAGQIVETGPTDRVLSDPQHPYTQRLLAAVPTPDPARRRAHRAETFDPAAFPPRVATRLVECAPGHLVRREAA